MKFQCYRESTQWVWDLSGIQNMHITDNVVVFLTDSMLNAPQSTKSVIKVVALMGNRFSMRFLEQLSDTTTLFSGNLHMALSNAIQNQYLTNSNTDDGWYRYCNLTLFNVVRLGLFGAAAERVIPLLPPFRALLLLANSFSGRHQIKQGFDLGLTGASGSLVPALAEA